MARIVFTATADPDVALVLGDLHAKAGKPTVVKYRESFRALYRHRAAFPDSGAPRPRIGPGIPIFPTLSRPAILERSYWERPAFLSTPSTPRAMI